MPGPPPKRSSQRRRQNKPDTPIEKAPAAPAEAVVVPKPDRSWHPAAKRWYVSLEASGQARFYEPSDWATAWLIAESMSRELKPQPVVDGEGRVTMVSFPPKGASLSAWLKAMTSLMVTEGDRRRLRLELERPATGGEETANVSWIDDARSRLREPG